MAEQPKNAPVSDASPAPSHRAAGPASVRCAVLTVSDTRTPDTDRSGQTIKDLLSEHGHAVAGYEIVPDEPDAIRRLLDQWIADPNIAAILSNGGTGIARRDTTYDVINGLLEKRLDGFGELFRALSFAEIGSAAMMSRAVAGSRQGTFIVAMPGSTNAVRLAMEKLVLPELSHVVYELSK
ncbi:MAG TPA: MogA/MoaB family molybdenum cofactor biosynthesis protein [Thermomicrobiales bacterium]|nr:MogA/MoaB family molybdenum cofactor biosynthesis protein [Thermomicrobiales bacterium]